MAFSKPQLDFAAKDRTHAVWPPGLTLRLRFSAQDLPPAYSRWVLQGGGGGGAIAGLSPAAKARSIS